MPKVDHRFSTKQKGHDEWLTPPGLLSTLGDFDLDPCSPHPEFRPWSTAVSHYHKEMDGLDRAWFGRVWLNPPYGKETFKWLDKLSVHQKGLALIFARTDTSGFFETVWNKADSILFLRGRLHFYRVDGQRAKYNCGAPSCIVSYSHEDTQILRQSNLDGKLVNL